MLSATRSGNYFTGKAIHLYGMCRTIFGRVLEQRCLPTCVCGSHPGCDSAGGSHPGCGSAGGSHPGCDSAGGFHPGCGSAGATSPLTAADSCGHVWTARPPFL
eukprot:365650-Chlamydomonas_euryale.AAC.12